MDTINPMAQLQFSFQVTQTTFHCTDYTVNVQRGIVWVLRQSIKANHLDALAVEMLIQHIEEIIQSDPRIKAFNASAYTVDALCNEMLALFFAGKNSISRQEVEATFNHFADHLPHYNLLQQPHKLEMIAYLVFIREIMHHLNLHSITASENTNA